MPIPQVCIWVDGDGDGVIVVEGVDVGCKVVVGLLGLHFKTGQLTAGISANEIMFNFG